MLTRKGLWIRIKIYGKRYPEGPRSCKLGIGKSIPAPMSPVLILAEVTSRRKLELSGGERNRVHLAKTLKEGANVLLLDEPTNDLDVNTLRALEEALLGFAGCAVIISHDRWFLDRIATHILAFEGNSQVYWFEGNYQEYEANKKERLGITDEEPKRIQYKKLLRD